MNPLGTLLLGLVVSTLRFLGGFLLGQQVKASIPSYTEKKFTFSLSDSETATIMGLPPSKVLVSDQLKGIPPLDKRDPR